MKNILQKPLSSLFLTFDEAIKLYNEASLAELMAAANTIKEKFHPGNSVTWQIDRNVNTTNVCVSGCKFCNFHCRLVERDKAYVTTIEQYREKTEYMFTLGGDQLLIQGGMNPELSLEYYENLFSTLKQHYPELKLNALGAPEVHFLSLKSGISYRQVLERLRGAGLDSLPGAGAEILNNDVRKFLSPGKCTADQWIEVMREAHLLGIPTTATMMYGHIETMEQRIEHLFRIRDLQAETGGFKAFIPWAFQGKGTQLEALGYAGGNNSAEYLRLIAMSRLILLNVPNIQASWLTMGVSTAQMALHGGANDMGSIMIEENVVSSAGSYNWLDAQGMEIVIRKAGFTPILRDQQYNVRK